MVIATAGHPKDPTTPSTTPRATSPAAFGRATGQTSSMLAQFRETLPLLRHNQLKRGFPSEKGPSKQQGNPHVIMINLADEQGDFEVCNELF